MDMFENELSVCCEDISLLLRGHSYIPWLDLYLNPRRLRGSDFLMRWSQGEWSESRLIQATNETERFYTIPYGPSGVAPSDDVRAFELYFERLEEAGLKDLKRPDLLVFNKTDKPRIDDFVSSIGGLKELPFTKENDLDELLDMALLAVECENSLWKCSMMPDFNSKLSPQKRLGGKLGLKKAAVLPTVIIKEEDVEPIAKWQNLKKIKVHVWHVFYDRAYGLSFDDALKLINEGLIGPTVQTFQAPGGATTKKVIYKFYYHYAYPLGVSKTEPELIPDFVLDKNGHILPYVKFKGGSLEISSEAKAILGQMKNERH